MNNVLKKTIAAAVTIVALAGFYLGSYLPLRKSQLYIEAYAQLPRVRSLSDFNQYFNTALDYYSPVGQEELVPAYLGVITDAVSGQNAANKQVPDILIKQAEDRARPIINSAPSFSYSQIILKLATLNRLAAEKFKDQNYYNRAVELYKLGLTYSTNRQDFLYGLLDLYLWRNDAADTKPLVQTVLKYWPNDERVKQIWNFLNTPTTSSN